MTKFEATELPSAYVGKYLGGGEITALHLQYLVSVRTYEAHLFP
jgi:hypothetical protein